MARLKLYEELTRAQIALVFAAQRHSAGWERGYSLKNARSTDDAVAQAMNGELWVKMSHVNHDPVDAHWLKRRHYEEHYAWIDGVVFEEYAFSPPESTGNATMLHGVCNRLLVLGNILKGEMSFIGPRPLSPEHVSLHDPLVQQRCLVRPGLIGLWWLRQRINIARALALEPKLLLLDEAVSALDKSVEAQVLNLLMDLKSELSLTYVFISHDLNVVQYVSDRVLVMYLGKVVEVGQVDGIYAAPKHPYTRALLATTPRFETTGRLPAISGRVPSPAERGEGCHFRGRCSEAVEVCATANPELIARSNSHDCACHVVSQQTAVSA